MKHFTKVEDFTKKDYLEVCRRAHLFQKGIEKGENFTYVCRGRILATMFFQESARTASFLQSAIIRLGGGWIGISGIEGTYIGSGEEELGDFLRSYACFCDIMAVRHKSLDLTKLSSDFPVPLINAMSGTDEHSLAALGWLYAIKKHFLNLKNIKIGIYGMTKSSRPAKALIKISSLFGLTIYEDPVINEFEAPEHIREFVKKRGGRLIRGRFENFISEVDFLYITEGLPQAGENPKLVKKYNQIFRPFGTRELKLLKRDACMIYGMPSKMTDGRLIVDPVINKSPQVISLSALKQMTYVTMALITYLLNIKI